MEGNAKSHDDLEDGIKEEGGQITVENTPIRSESSNQVRFASS
jgi:hypothetical protein